MAGGHDQEVLAPDRRAADRQHGPSGASFLTSAVRAGVSVGSTTLSRLRPRSKGT